VTTESLQIRVEVDEAGRARAYLDGTGDALENIERKSKGAAGGVDLVAKALGALGVAAAVRGLLKTAQEMEDLRAKLQAIEGSLTGANARFRELNELSAKTPFGIADMTKAYVELKNTGLDPMDGSLAALMDTSVALGGGTEKLASLTTALGVAYQRGTLDSRAMLQLMRQGVPVFDALARATGKTAGEVQELAEQGRLGRSHIKLLIDELGRSNAGAAATDFGTLSQTFKDLGDAGEALAHALGEGGVSYALRILISDVTDGVNAIAALLGETNRASTEAASLDGVLKKLAASVAMIAGGTKVLGAGVATVVEGYGAFRDAISAVIALLDVYAAAAERALRLDFAGARAEMASGMEDFTRRFGAAMQRSESAARNFIDTYKDLMREVTDRLAAIAGEADAAGEALGTGLANGAGTAADGSAILGDEVRRLVTDLERKTATLGLTRTELLQYEKAQAQAAAATDAERIAIGKAYDALIRRTVAMDATTRSTRAAEQEVKRFLDRITAEIDAHGKSEELLLREAAARAAAAASTAEQREQIEQLTQTRIRQQQAERTMLAELAAQQRAIEDVNRTMQDFQDLQRDIAATLGGPVAQANQRYADALALIAKRERELLALGPARQQDLEEIRQLRKDLARVFETDIAQAQESARQAAMATVNAYTGVLLQGLEAARPLLRDALMSGDWDSLGRNLGEQIVAGLVDAFLDQAVIRPLQDAILRATQTGANGQSGGGWGSVAQGVNQGSMYGEGGTGTTAGGWMGAAAMAYGGWRNAQQGGSAGSTIMQFTAAGAAIGGIWGAAIGAVVGILVAIFKKPKTPEVRIGGEDSGVSGSGNFSTVFGTVRAGSRTAKWEDFVGTLQQFDRAMLDLVRGLGASGQEIDAIRDRLANWSIHMRGNAISPEAVLSSRFNAIAETIAPQWAGYLSGIGNLEQRVESFAALHGIRDLVDGITETLDNLGGDPIQRLRTELRNLETAIDTTGAALRSALEAGDPKEIFEAAHAAEQAVMRRLTAEIELVRTLEAALIEAQAQARALDMALLQRIASVGGGSGRLASAAAGNINTLRDLVTGTADPDRALAFLHEFVGTVDTWLAASIARVNELAASERALVQAQLDGIAARRAAIEAELSALAGERDSIVSGARERTQAQFSAQAEFARAYNDAMRAARDAELAALREQLSIAQQWGRVVDQSARLIEQMTFGTANPLTGFGRLEALTAAIGRGRAAMDGAEGEGRARLAGELLGLLQQRLQMVQGEGLFDRSSDDYLALYNETRRAIADVQGIATPEADLAAELQQRIADLQAQGNDIGFQTSVNTRDLVVYTHAERVRLDAIAAEEAERMELLAELAEQEAELQRELVNIQTRAEVSIQALQREALDYYEWARSEGERLNSERTAAITDALNEITGGRPIDEFIAERMSAATGLLEQIRDSMAAFLESVTNQSPRFSGGGPITGGGGLPPREGDLRIASTPTSAGVTPTITFAPMINVDGGADPATVKRMVRDTVRDEAAQFATLVGREMRYG
jgi:tape measure domain-containing protein